MIIFLYGEETYRSRRKLEEIIGQYKKTHKNGLSLIFFEGESLDFESFKDALCQVSMFGEKKLFVLKNIFKNQVFKEKFLKNYKNLPGLKAFSRKTPALPKKKKEEEEKRAEEEDIVLFFEEGEIPKKDKFFNFLKDEAKSQRFEVLKGEKLKNWIRKEFLKLEGNGDRGKGESKISPEAMNRLVESAGDDLWRLSNEIKKLAFFKKEGEIGLKDVEALIKPRVETAIFKTIDAVSQKDKKRALLLIRRHLEKGDSPLYLLSMINFQFRNILAVKDLLEKRVPYYSILKLTKLHPFVVKKSYEQANRFTLWELKKIYQKIFEADLNIKTGKIEPETALELLIAEI